MRSEPTDATQMESTVDNPNPPPSAHCSWCFVESEHELYRAARLGRNVFRCTACRNLTVRCRYCSNMAAGPADPASTADGTSSILKRLRARWHSELCGEHDGSVGSFEALSAVLEDLENYEELFRPKRRNLLRLGKIVVGSAGGILVVAPAALFAAPAFAGALGAAGVLGAASTGTAISTLSGAALTSASLAAVGTTGVTVVTAAGASLGAVLGGAVSNAYFGAVRDFSIRKYNEGAGPCVIFINGFLSQKTDDPRTWKPALRRWFMDSPWYHVNWEAQTRASLGHIFLRDASGKAARRFAIKLAKRATRKAAGRFNPLSWAASAADLLANPWHVAMVKASMTGVLLADLVSRIRDREVILMGHSLGARVVYYALQALSTKSNAAVRDAYLLGGAVGAGDEFEWQRAAAAVSGSIHNCYSANDRILRLLYRSANFMRSSPIGIQSIECASPHIRNWDCSDLVEGHNAWKAALPGVLERIGASQGVAA